MSMADNLSRVNHDGKVMKVAPLKMREYKLSTVCDKAFNVEELWEIQAADSQIAGWNETLKKDHG